MATVNTVNPVFPVFDIYGIYGKYGIYGQTYQALILLILFYPRRTCRVILAYNLSPLTYTPKRHPLNTKLSFTGS